MNAGWHVSYFGKNKFQFWLIWKRFLVQSFRPISEKGRKFHAKKKKIQCFAFVFHHTS